jgi:hypothetical protein
VSGSNRHGEWVRAVMGGPTESAEGVELAVAEAVRRVEEGESTACGEVKALLARYPSLKQDRPNHPLLALAGYYALEMVEGTAGLITQERTYRK